MGKILSYYTKYLKDVPEYNKWNSGLNCAQNSSAVNNDRLKNKAKLIAEPIFLFDKYEHERMEDSETFYQTFNMELMSLSTFISSIPALLSQQKTIDFVSKFSDKSKILKNCAHALSKFKNSPSKKFASMAAFAAGSLLFIAGIKHSLESQLGIIRKASYDASKQIINDEKIFADLDEKQEKELNSLINQDFQSNSALVDKLKDKVDINSSFKTVKNYNIAKSDYLDEKSKYFEQFKREDSEKNNLAESEVSEASENKLLIENYLKNVEHGVLETLRKVETISNISYSAMFTGGFLEYLLTDKLVGLLKIQNKPLQMAVKIGVPLATYLLLNKNISDIENKAILATKYKYMKKFTENPLAFENPEDDKKSLPDFIKTIAADMKEYSKFSEEQLPKIEEKLNAKKHITLTEKQQKDSKRLQQGTSKALNIQREHLYNQTVGIETLSETILGPIDIISAALGAGIGKGLSKYLPKVPKKALMGLGAVLTFIPAAIIEAKLTKQQKLAEKTAVMLAIKDMSETRNYALNIKPENKNSSSNLLEKYLKK